MNEYALARALHVLGVVLWIGGVAMVTTVLLPAVRRHGDPAGQLAFFHRLERRFATQARWTTALVGLTGFWLTWRFDLWWRFAKPAFWWMHAMVLVWGVFTLMLFVLEPFFLDRRMHSAAQHDPVGAMRRIQRLHWFLLTISLLTVLGAVAGSHGSLF